MAPHPAPPPSDPLANALERVPLLPVLRADDPAAVADLADRLVEGGLRALELTTTTPGWEALLAERERRWPGVVVGVGTVTTADLARRATDGGADFLVSPWPSPAVREVATAAGQRFVEGGATPGEVAAAAAQGPAKLFPAHLGGPQLVRSLLAVLPGARIVPTGGIRLEQVGEWLSAGAWAVGVGSDLGAAGDVAQRVADVVGPAAGAVGGTL